MAEIFGDQVDVADVLAKHGDMQLVHGSISDEKHSSDKVDPA